MKILKVLLWMLSALLLSGCALRHPPPNISTITLASTGHDPRSWAASRPDAAQATAKVVSVASIYLFHAQGECESISDSPQRARDLQTLNDQGDVVLFGSNTSFRIDPGYLGPEGLLDLSICLPVVTDDEHEGWLEISEFNRLRNVDIARLMLLRH